VPSGGKSPARKIVLPGGKSPAGRGVLPGGNCPAGKGTLPGGNSPARNSALAQWLNKPVASAASTTICLKLAFCIIAL